jgi:uncharacterized protein
MHYLIDGHNLIGRMPDIDLADPDDEIKLILRLRSWAARKRRRRVTLIFDRGLPGGTDRGLSSGDVKVVFASSGRSADMLLIKRIRSVGNPKETTLVSSDQRIIHEAEARRMPVMKAEEFVMELTSQGKQSELAGNEETQAEDKSLNESDIAMWLDLFGAQDE